MGKEEHMLTDVERFRRAHAICVEKSRSGQHIEIRALWSSVAASYSFLLRREERLVAEAAARRGRAAEASVRDHGG
jgi:hypothetical protein